MYKVDLLAMGRDEAERLFNPKPEGEVVNSHVRRVPGQKETDYGQAQRLLESTDYSRLFSSFQG